MRRPVALALLVLALAPAASALDVSLAAMRVTGPVSVASLDPRIDGSGVVIAIIDTGVHDQHESFLDARLSGVDVSLPCNPLPGQQYDVSCYASSNPDDASMHGTGVAGIALGRGDGTGRLRGVASGARLFEIKAADSLPAGVPAETGGVEYQHVLQALRRGFLYVERWNAAHGGADRIDVVSCSCSVWPEDDSTDILGAAERLVDAGVVVVASAGNCGDCGSDAVGSPALSPKVIGVGGLDDKNTVGRSDDAVWTGSSRGPNGDLRKPDVVAPAVAIESPEHLPGEPSGGSFYASMTGTSAAAPHVAGVVALMLEAAPALTPAQVKDILLASTYGSPTPGEHDAAWGWGAVDAHLAVRAALASTNAPPVAAFDLPAPAFVNETVTFDGSASVDPEGRVVAYRWSFGDGALGTGRTATHQFASPGSYVVRLEVEDHLGAVAEVTRAFEVRPLPPLEARAEVDATSGLVGAPFRFRANGSTGYGALSYRWDFGDGANATGAPVEHAYAAPGSYLVRLQVTDAAGRTSVAELTVQVAPGPLSLGIEVAPPQTPGAAHVFTARGAPAGSVLTWRVDQETTVATRLERVLSPGDHLVALHVRAPDGREANATASVRVAAPSPPTGPTPDGEEAPPQEEAPADDEGAPAPTPTLTPTPTPITPTSTPPLPSPVATPPASALFEEAAPTPATPDAPPRGRDVEIPLPWALALVAIALAATRRVSAR